MQLETKQGQTKQLGMKSCRWEPRGSMQERHVAPNSRKQAKDQEPGARTTSAAQSCAKGPSKSPPGLRGSPAAPEDSLGLGDRLQP